jgi:hypothetical protein
MSETPEVPCPFCREQIKPDAAKCRWCGEYLKKDLELRNRLKKRVRLNLPAPDPAPVLVLGILGLVVCGVFGAFALTQGNAYLARCRALRIEPSGAAVAGRILGIISCVIMAIQAIILALVVMGSIRIH